jgi:hypothetical protein
MSRLIIFLTTLFTALATAASNAAILPFQITNLSITKVRAQNVTITFTVHDPDKQGLDTEICNATWPIGSRAYPQDSYIYCGDSTFGWNMETYKNIEEFTLGLTHTYTDPSVGDPPYDQITNFARANLTLANHPCTQTDRKKTCAQEPGKIIKAPIWG